MALCSYCKAETQLFEDDLAICISCSRERDANCKPTASDGQIRSVLHRNLMTATARARGASEAFTAIVQAVPSATPPPDGTQRIQSASRYASIARLELMRAHNQLNDYLSRGIVPNDLKRSG
jgi:hypothetical protein